MVKLLRSGAAHFENCRSKACLPRQVWQGLRSPRFSTHGAWHERRKIAFARDAEDSGIGCSRLIYVTYDMVNFE